MYDIEMICFASRKYGCWVFFGNGCSF